MGNNKSVYGKNVDLSVLYKNCLMTFFARKESYEENNVHKFHEIETNLPFTKFYKNTPNDFPLNEM